ncbi:MAG: hypothetical protein K8R60_08895 [Burkholderiales bacterium]|nr:hypothetical protein [Burkholderiales bacterium]
MSVRGRLWLAACGWLCAAACQAAPDFGAERASGDARYASAWVLAGADNQRLPFAVVDKRDARIYVFEAGGRLVGASAALLGAAPGDFAVGDMTGRAPASLTPAERTTPAGRFASEPGRNDKGEEIVWIDYAASLAIHRLRPAPAQERRAARLASPSPDDNRISAGCVVVPVAFYETVVAPTLGSGRGVVYVLPESRPVHSMFGALELSLLVD